MADPNKVLSEWDEASLFDKWTFSVANDMLNKGLREPLESEDMARIPFEDTAAEMGRRLKEEYFRSQPFWFLPRLMVALIRMSGVHATIVSVLTVTEGLVRIAMPLVLIFLLKAIEDEDKDKGYVWAAVLSGLAFSQTVIHHICYFFSMRAGWNWKTSCTAFIYEGLFHLQGGALQSTATGRMINLISNDVARFEEFAVMSSSSWEAFIEVVLILLILIYILDWPSAVAGVGSTILTIPLVIYLSKYFSYYRTATAVATDNRVKHIAEVIDGIASVKAYAWEKSFFLLINKLRKVEVDHIASSQQLRAVNQGISYSSTPVVTFVTFMVFSLNGGTLTVPIVFSTISLLQVLRMTIGRMWTRAIETGSEAIASCYRIEAFLDTAFQSAASQQADGNTATKATECPAGPQLDENEILRMSRCGYYYGDDPTKQAIQNIEFSVKRGEVVMIVGPVGCGKSTLLTAVLGEMNTTRPGCRLLASHSKVAYCSQSPWILAGSIKANIVLTRSSEDNDLSKPKDVDEAIYAKALETCRIVEDLESWPAYDATEIGERGVSISGGQKARIALARAVYSDADCKLPSPCCTFITPDYLCVTVFILDDPLSAVDAHVGKALMHECIINTLKKNNKSVILVTHQLQYLRHADKIIVLNKAGHQIFGDSYAALCKNTAVLGMLQIEHSTRSPQSPAVHSRKTMPIEPAEIVQAVLGLGDEEEEEEPAKDQLPARGVKVFDKSIKFGDNDPEKAKAKVIADEDKQIGSISLGVYMKYITAGGVWSGLGIILLIMASQGLLMMCDYWVNWWAVGKFLNQSNSLNLVIFAILVGMCIIVGFLRASLWFRHTLRCANNLHNNCLFAVTHSPLLFFISNPTGRILNRFTKDQNQADEFLPVMIFSFLEASVFCLSGVILVCISIPWLILLLPFLFYCFSLLRRKYTISTREIKRIEATSRSFIYANFSYTLSGIYTLRAYDIKHKCVKTFYQYVNNNGRAWFSFLLASRWLGYRLDLETNVIMFFVCFFAVFLSSQVNTGLIGFTLVYIIQLNALFQWVVRQSAEIETQMTSIERIYAYTALPPEAGYLEVMDDVIEHRIEVYDEEQYQGSINQLLADRHVVARPSDQQVALMAPTGTHSVSNDGYYNTRWLALPDRVTSLFKGADAAGQMLTIPSYKAQQINRLSDLLTGRLRLEELTATYRVDLPPVLSNISLDIAPGSKVGICGRTGSGKSSLLLSLLRLNILLNGNIFIDNINLCKIDVEIARKLITIIPQEPHLFSGSLRYNLDPFSIYSDEDIFNALQQAHIAYILDRDSSANRSIPLRVKLDMVVEEKGSNFSIGEKQLLSLARAILNNNKIILMDEVTANIDYITDKLIQETIRTSPILCHNTIITIAHRLRTIADYDRIIVMNAGRIVEDAAPHVLLLKEGSLFRSLAQESGEFEEICKIAGQKHGEQRHF